MSILTASPDAVNFDPAETTPATEVEPRPTFDFFYYPDLEEERDAREMFADEGDEPTDAEWEAMAEDALALDMACSGHWAW